MERVIVEVFKALLYKILISIPVRLIMCSSITAILVFGIFIQCFMTLTSEVTFPSGEFEQDFNKISHDASGFFLWFLVYSRFRIITFSIVFFDMSFIIRSIRSFRAY